MPAFTATAPGKIILFGEHAVVYGEPALAAPVSALQARAVVTADISGESGDIWIDAQDIELSTSLYDLSVDHPLREAITIVASKEKLDRTPACRIQITSTIPPCSGLGSSAAVTAALIRAFSAFLGTRLSHQEVSDLTFEIEKLQHGTPSGIDNSVVVFEKPVYYQKGSPIEYLSITNPFQILIADSGKAGETRKAVELVREKWLSNPEDCTHIFSEIGGISKKAKDLITSGNYQSLGPLMDQNHGLLRELGVSTLELDHLIEVAHKAGASGAKLSGGGLGGHLIVLPGDRPEPIGDALLKEGATNILLTTIRK